MDSAVQLALMSKAKKVFCKDQSIFLSFPVSPLPYTRRELDFLSEKDPGDLAQSKRNLYAFSTLVNLIPSEEAWVQTETRFLWDVYEEVLKADYADSSRTPQEEVEYREAQASLGKETEQGWVDSPAYIAYKRYRD